MSMNKKSPLVMATRMKDQLAKRLPALTVTQDFDTSGNPVIRIDDGTPATTEQHCFIRVLELSTITTNSIGSSAPTYRPLVVQMASEATAAVATVSRLTAANMAVIMAELVRPGARVELYLSASGTAADVAAITGTALATIDPDLYWGVYAGS